MAIILPAAPKNFCDPSLNTLRDKLLAVNGASKGRITLLTAPPIQIESAWNEVGAGYDTDIGNNRGTNVVGHKDITNIGTPILGPTEDGGDRGYKIQFDEITDIPVYIDGSGTQTAIVVGIALIEGVDVFSLGLDDNLRYIIKVDDLTVTDGKLITLPKFEITLNYSEIDTGL